MNKSRSSNQSRSVLKAAAIGILSTLIFGAAFRTGYRGEQQATR